MTHNQDNETAKIDQAVDAEDEEDVIKVITDRLLDSSYLLGNTGNLERTLVDDHKDRLQDILEKSLPAIDMAVRDVEGLSEITKNCVVRVIDTTNPVRMALARNYECFDEFEPICEMGIQESTQDAGEADCRAIVCASKMTDPWIEFGELDPVEREAKLLQAAEENDLEYLYSIHLMPAYLRRKLISDDVFRSVCIKWWRRYRPSQGYVGVMDELVMTVSVIEQNYLYAINTMLMRVGLGPWPDYGISIGLKDDKLFDPSAFTLFWQ